MRSQVRFAMHPDDESSLVRELLRDPSIVFVDGPRWNSAQPPTSRSISSIGSYCIVWSTKDISTLAADFIPSCNDWYCRAEHSTIQFLRSSLADTFLTEGRVAIGTSAADADVAASVERRYKLLGRFLKRSYSNAVIGWSNPPLTPPHATSSRSSNPSTPDASLWVGPAALDWLRADPVRCIKLDARSRVEGRLTP